MVVAAEKRFSHLQSPVGINDMSEGDFLLPDLFQRHQPEVSSVTLLILIARVFRSRNAPWSEGESIFGSIQVRMAEDFESEVRASCRSRHRALEIAGRGVEVDGFHVLEIRGRRQDEAVAHPSGVVPARNDFQLAFQVAVDPAFSVDHQGKFPEGHAVDGADRQPAYSRLVFHVEDGPVHIEPVRIRAVQNYHFLAVSGTGLHQMVHRDVVGVVPQTDILDVHKEDVEFVHALRRREMGPCLVERKDFHTGLFIHAALDVLSGICSASESVFGGEDGGHVDPFFQQGIDDMLTVFDLSTRP